MYVISFYPRKYNLIGRYIASWSGHYNHIVIAVDTKRVNKWLVRLGYEPILTDSKTVCFEASMLRGVRAVPTKDALKRGLYDCLHMKLPNLYEEMVTLFLISNLNKRYSFRQLIGVIYRFLGWTNLRVFMTPGFICSELVARALRIAFPDAFKDRPLDFLLPDEVYLEACYQLASRES